ncbi:hypothetical protein PsorP6_011842 [Peronosclerospora sorghi]|uniref:Uncharacterized protein n=1 Tax=Peronosclerospora sorghi TaxID=230839 RepID=A0ACC0WJH7_9STRA|nr:hypothetical protein PsorP6_011842 [Peronosclerospora sorghi]
MSLHVYLYMQLTMFSLGVLDYSVTLAQGVSSPSGAINHPFVLAPGLDHTECSASVFFSKNPDARLIMAFEHHYAIVPAKFIRFSRKLMIISSLPDPGLSGSAIVCTNCGVLVGYLGGGLDGQQIMSSIHPMTTYSKG